MSPIDAALYDQALPADLLDQLVLKYGSHVDREDGVCVMEAAAWVAGLPHTDRPACACDVCGIIARRLNDDIRDDEERTRLLRSLVLQLAGSKSTAAVETARGCAVADWVVRTQAPTYLDLYPQSADLALRLRAIGPLVTRSDCEAALPELRAVREEAQRRRREAWTRYMKANSSFAATATAAATAAVGAAAADAADAAAADWYFRKYDVAGGVGADTLARARPALRASGNNILNGVNALRSSGQAGVIGLGLVFGLALVCVVGLCAGVLRQRISPISRQIVQIKDRAVDCGQREREISLVWTSRRSVLVRQAAYNYGFKKSIVREGVRLPCLGSLPSVVEVNRHPRLFRGVLVWKQSPPEQTSQSLFCRVSGCAKGLLLRDYGSKLVRLTGSVGGRFDPDVPSDGSPNVSERDEDRDDNASMVGTVSEWRGSGHIGLNPRPIDVFSLFLEQPHLLSGQGYLPSSGQYGSYQEKQCRGFNAKTPLVAAFCALISGFAGLYFGLRRIKLRPNKHFDWLGVAILIVGTISVAWGWNRLALLLVCGV
jgi:hypothetical protein